MTRFVAMTVVALLSVSTAARADGDDDEPPMPKKSKKSSKGDDTPAAGELEKVGSPKARLTLPGGKFMLTVAAEANMAKGAVAKPHAEKTGRRQFRRKDPIT